MKSSFLTNVLATASTVLVVIGVVIGVTTVCNFIPASNEATGMIKFCCFTGIAGFALTAVCSGLEYRTKTTYA